MGERIVSRQEVEELARTVIDVLALATDVSRHSNENLHFEPLWSIAWNLTHDDQSTFYYEDDLGEAWNTLVTGHKKATDYLKSQEKN